MLVNTNLFCKKRNKKKLGNFKNISAYIWEDRDEDLLNISLHSSDIVFSAVIGYVKSNLTILDTDYKSYALAWSCNEYLDGLFNIRK